MVNASLVTIKWTTGLLAPHSDKASLQMHNVHAKVLCALVSLVCSNAHFSCVAAQKLYCQSG